jgi:hypothetical protein
MNCFSNFVLIYDRQPSWEGLSYCFIALGLCHFMVFMIFTEIPY